MTQRDATPVLEEVKARHNLHLSEMAHQLLELRRDLEEARRENMTLQTLSRGETIDNQAIDPNKKT